MNAFIFPGQGAQFPGMGKSLYEQSKEAKALFKKANSILGFKITETMFEGEAADLKQTKVTGADKNIEVLPAWIVTSKTFRNCLNVF